MDKIESSFLKARVKHLEPQPDSYKHHLVYTTHQTP